jgi:hypothetical protein
VVEISGVLPTFFPLCQPKSPARRPNPADLPPGRLSCETQISPVFFLAEGVVETQILPFSSLLACLDSHPRAAPVSSRRHNWSLCRRASSIRVSSLSSAVGARPAQPATSRRRQNVRAAPDHAPPRHSRTSAVAGHMLLFLQPLLSSWAPPLEELNRQGIAPPESRAPSLYPRKVRSCTEMVGISSTDLHIPLPLPARSRCC